MADPQQWLAKAPRHAERISFPLDEDASTVVISEVTADTSPGRYAHSQDVSNESVSNQYEGYARIFGFDVDHTNRDNLSFPAFRPMRYLLNDEAARYLVSERRWSNRDDSDDTVGQKNVIIIFVCIATIEECLVDAKSEKLLPVIGPFEALMDTLGMRYLPNGRPRSYKFLWAIRKAFVDSRADEIKCHLATSNGSPREPSDLSILDRMLLDVVDRHIAFLQTKKPLTHLCVPIPLDKVLRLRLIQIKNQLRSKDCIEKCWKTFVPTIHTYQQTSWPQSGMATTWEPAQAKRIAKQSNMAVDSSPTEHQDDHLFTKPEVSRDAKNLPGMESCPTARWTPNGSMSSSQQTPVPSAGEPDAGQPDALSGLQIFKTAVCQVNKVIRGPRDSTNLREFIDQIEEDVKQFHGTLQLRTSRPTAGHASTTGIPRPQLDVSLEPQCIRSLMLIGLLLIDHLWNEQDLTDNLRQKILVDILEELRVIKESVDQVYSAQE